MCGAYESYSSTGPSGQFGKTPIGSHSRRAARTNEMAASTCRRCFRIQQAANVQRSAASTRHREHEMKSNRVRVEVRLQRQVGRLLVRRLLHGRTLYLVRNAASFGHVRAA